MHGETSELRNSSELPRKFPEIFGNSRIIFGNSGTQQEKNLTPLAQKKLAGQVQHVFPYSQALSKNPFCFSRSSWVFFLVHSKPSADTMNEYNKKVEFLKGLIETQKMVRL